MDIKNIAAAVDLSDDLSDAVLLAAKDLAEQYHAALHVVDAWPPLSASGWPYSENVDTKIVTEDADAREERAADLRTWSSCYAPGSISVVPIGHASDALSDYVREHDIDLLVLGSHQKGLFQRVFEGTASAKIMQAAPCGVFVVTPSLARTLVD